MLGRDLEFFRRTVAVPAIVRVVGRRDVANFWLRTADGAVEHLAVGHGAGGSSAMNMSPIISKALVESRQRDMIAEARNAQFVRAAERGNRAAREAAPAPRPVARWRWPLGLARLLRAH
jgi:hypothetical protein